MRNNENKIRLTERDFKLLLDVYENTMLMFSQIHGRHFGGAARVTVQNRLGQLTESGFVGRIRVGTVVYHGEAKFIGVIYLMTRLGLRGLKLRYPEMALRDEPVVLDTNNLVHDLKLIEVRDFLKKRFGGIKWLNAKNFLKESRREIRQPDLVGLGPNGEMKLAVELDLTVKSERAYRGIINQYGISGEYKNVLYVAGSKAMADKIREVITGVKSHLNKGLFPTGKFYFATLSEIQDDPMNAKMTNGKTDLETILNQNCSSKIVYQNANAPNLNPN